MGGEYIRSRVAAEKMLLDYCARQNLPGVAMCVANTYGPGDWLPTPHGGLLAAAVRGRLPFFIDGYDAEVVGVEDAAAGDAPGRRTRPCRRTLHRLGALHEHPCRP